MKKLSRALGIVPVILAVSCTTTHDLARSSSDSKLASLDVVTGYSQPAPSPAVQEAPAPAAASTPNVTEVAKVAPPSSDVVTTVTITFDQVSEDLGIPKTRLEKQAKILANFLKKNKVPSNVCIDDNDENTDKLCSLIDQIRDERGAAANNSSGGRRVPIRPQHFEAQQSMGYARLAKSIYREPASRVYAWAPKMLATTSCPRNLSAVALRKIESLLPSAEVQAMMEKLYDHAAACLQPDDDGYEVTHLRQALLRVLWGNNAKAREAIARAATAKDSSEKSRVLYWVGCLETNPRVKAKAWDRLVQDYPLSYHALEVWNQMSVDPYEIFSKRPTLSLNRISSDQNASVALAIHWLELLYIQGHIEAAQKLSRWVASVHKDELTPSNLLYLSSLKSGNGTPLNAITFLTRQINENSVILNQQTLKMLFPKPFFDLFDRASPNTDTYLILSVARQESGFNPHARSPANAQGLMQVLPATARALSGRRRNNLYDSEVNATLGVKYLSQLIEKFNSVELALAGYNAGPLRIPEWQERFPTQDGVLFMDLIPFKETRNYVSSIVRNNYWYERIYGNDPGVVANRASKKGLQRSGLVTRLVSSHMAAGVAASNARVSAAATAKESEPANTSNYVMPDFVREL